MLTSPPLSPFHRLWPLQGIESWLVLKSTRGEPVGAVQIHIRIGSIGGMIIDTCLAALSPLHQVPGLSQLISVATQSDPRSNPPYASVSGQAPSTGRTLWAHGSPQAHARGPSHVSFGSIVSRRADGVPGEEGGAAAAGVGVEVDFMQLTHGLDVTHGSEVTRGSHVRDLTQGTLSGSSDPERAQRAAGRLPPQLQPAEGFNGQWARCSVYVEQLTLPPSSTSHRPGTAAVAAAAPHELRPRSYSYFACYSLPGTCKLGREMVQGEAKVSRDVQHVPNDHQFTNHTTDSWIGTSQISPFKSTITIAIITFPFVWQPCACSNTFAHPELL